MQDKPISVQVENIQKFEAGIKIKEETVKGEVVDRRVVTAVSFIVEDMTAKVFDDIFWAAKNGAQVNVTFSCPQGMFGPFSTREPAKAEA